MKPTPAPSHFPYTSHRTMAQVMRDEERSPNVRKKLGIDCENQCDSWIATYENLEGRRRA